MTHPITIIVYPLFGGWRAECKACGAYGNSDDSKHRSHIGVAIENLSKNQHAFSEKSKTCEHHYGSYKPRVNCYIDYNNIKSIKEPVSNQGCETFPRIMVGNKYHIDIFNAKGITHEWSAYSKLRYAQKQELKAAKEAKEAKAAQEKAVVETPPTNPTIDNAKDLLDHSVKQAAKELDYIVGKHKISNWQYILYTIMVAITVVMFSVVIGAAADVGGCREFLYRLTEGCIHGVCL